MRDPFEFFAEWFADAQRSEPTLPDAMSVSTVDASGMPNARMVLLKGVDPGGFVFYTNLGSPKSQELQANPRAALCFHWKSLSRQVRVAGSVEPVSDKQADSYFASRARLSQIGAWASRQSEELPDRMALERRVAIFTARFGVGPVPRPAFWSGYRVVPQRIEFWQELPFRLHRREVYSRDVEANEWQHKLLYP
ncbi:MAG: pyridoxamine 5'-phosphate oxidase [Kiritimatiellia bacterium]|jgi:pyridoxamine 5'-phosphate oxidase